MNVKQWSVSDAKWLKFFFYLFKLGGVLTISMKSELPRATFHNSSSLFSHSKLGIIYNIFLALFVCVAGYYTVNFSYNVNDGNDRLEFEKIVDAFQTLLTTATALFIVIIFIARRETALKLAIQLVDAYKTSRLFRSRAGQKRYGVRLTFVTYLVTTTLYFGTIPTTTFSLACYFFFTSFFNLVIHIFFMQYCLALRLVGDCFAVINDALLELKNKNTISEPCVYLDLKIIEGAKMQRLAQLRLAYGSLTKLSRSLGEFYSLPMLLCSTNAFVTLTDYLYYAMKPVVLRSYEAPLLLTFHCGTQIILSFMSLAMLTSSASRVISESNLTGEIVNESLDDVQNDRLAKKLNQFSNYLLHKDIRFTVLGLFTLDGTMLIGVISSITTYLVIVLQFKNSGYIDKSL